MNAADGTLRTKNGQILKVFKVLTYGHIVVEYLRAERNILLEKVFGHIGEKAHLGHRKEIVELLHSYGVLKVKIKLK